MPTVFDEDEESVIERRDRERDNGRVDNDEAIPLIPNVKLDIRKTIHAIHVWKMDPPGDGFKGTVPPHTTYSTIAKLYGNGVYDFHACTIDEKILRRNSGVKIAWAPPADDPPETDYTPGAPPADIRLLQWQAEQHAKDSARVEAFGRMVVDTTRSTAEQQITAITRSQESATARDRDFFAGILAQQQQFFQSMMLMSQQSHQQTTERAREDFRQTIQVMQMSHDREKQSNDPALLLGLFERGLALGSGQSDDDPDEVPWVEAIKAAGGAIKDITSAANLKTIAVAKARPNPTPNPAPPPKPVNGAPAPSQKKALPFTKEELAEIIRLKRIMDQKGMDFSATVRNASQYFVQGEDIDENEAGQGPGEDVESPAEPIADELIGEVAAPNVEG